MESATQLERFCRALKDDLEEARLASAHITLGMQRAGVTRSMRRYTDRLFSALARMEARVEHVLDHADIGQRALALCLATHDAVDLIAGAIDLAFPSSARRVEIDLEDGLAVICDRERFYQVLGAVLVTAPARISARRGEADVSFSVESSGAAEASALALARGLVEAQGGRFETAAHKAGEGQTRVIFSLPRAD
jgi:signal transduction histidine kinase